MRGADTTLDKSLLLMLRPIARFWIRRGEKLQRFIDLLKVALVEAAVEEIQKRGEKVSVSRIYAVCGVHRKDAAKIHNDTVAPQTQPDIITRVVGFWAQNESYRTADGKPRVLQYEQFEELVSNISRSVGPRAILFELQRTGAVQLGRAGYKLVYTNLRHTEFFDRSMNLVARNVDSMMQAADENMNNSHSIPNVFVRTEFDNVFLDDVPKIRQWLEREGKKFHSRAREFVGQFDADICPAEGRTAGAKVAISSFSTTSDTA
ncbi:MAG: hypothetical protein KDD66_06335 [Bdellovibrionales bacterium]|nr:hypothetical protein [Bdellovibrionales bacterium]